MTLDPPRLKDSAELPRELKGALDALRAGPGDAARVARVGARLGALLDAPAPPPPPPAALPRMGPHTLKALRLFAAGVAVGVSVMWLTRWQPQPETHVAARPVPSAQPPAQRPAPTSAAPAPATELPAAGGEPEHARSLRSATRPTPHNTARDRRAAPAGMATSSARGEAGGARSAPYDTAASEHTRETPAPQPARAQAGADAAVPEAPPSPPKSEVELLFEARTLRHSAPRQALALLDEHAQRFGEGMLAPEREAMAIEILHGLGQRAQAAERLTRYRARYPKSLHLPRLEKMR